MIDNPLPLDIILDANQDKLHVDLEGRIIVKAIKRKVMEKPTVEQVVWVFDKLIKDIGTFRYLIYDKMGFTEDNYLELYEAGGMAINNALVEMYYDDIDTLVEKQLKEGQP
jgi:phosphoglycerol transferase MdoB-like AlkP superfamily enzyme